MSLSALRRSAIAASSVLAVSGAVAAAAAPSASAAQLPWGAVTATGTTSIFGSLNTSWGGLKGIDQALAGVGDSAVPPPASFPPASGTGALSTAQAYQIAADFTDTTIGSGSTAVSPSSSSYAAALKAGLGASAYATDAAQVTLAAESWPELSALVGSLYNIDTADFPNGLFSVDSDLTVTSAAKVSKAGAPIPYSVTVSTTAAAASGYVLPSAFTLTFPANFGVNVGLASVELPYQSSPSAMAAEEANPPAKDQIGTVTFTSPVASSYLGITGDTATGGVFAVNAHNSLTQPDLELNFGHGIYALATFSGISFPLTVTFGEVTLPGGTAEPLPFSNVTLAFPAKTSPLTARRCTNNLGTANGTATDELAGLAAQFGDTTDGYDATTGTTSAVSLSSSATVVTDVCAPGGRALIRGFHRITKRTSSRARRAADKATLSVTLSGDSGTKFNTATVRLPGGFTFRGRQTVTQHFHATARRALRLKGVKVSAKERRTRAKKVALSYTVRYTENGGTFTSVRGSAKVRL